MLRNRAVFQDHPIDVENVFHEAGGALLNWIIYKVKRMNRDVCQVCYKLVML